MVRSVSTEMPGFEFPVSLQQAVLSLIKTHDANDPMKRMENLLSQLQSPPKPDNG